MLKRLVTSYYNQTIANIYGTKVGIMFKYTNFITKHLVYKDKKTSHVIDIAVVKDRPISLRPLTLLQGFQICVEPLIVYMSSLLKC